MEALFSPFKPPPPLPDAREEPAKPLVVEPLTDAHAKPSASLDATPENMSMLNTPDNGAPNGAATTHRGQVAPSASHTTQVAGGEFIAAGADSLQTNIIGKRDITATVTGGNAGANDDAEELVGADHADVHSTLDTLLDQEDISAVIQYLTSKVLVGNLDSQAMTRLLNDTEAFGKDILQEIGIFVEKYFPGSGRPSSLEKIAFRASLHARRESVLQGYYAPIRS